MIAGRAWVSRDWQTLDARQATLKAAGQISGAVTHRKPLALGALIKAPTDEGRNRVRAMGTIRSQAQAYATSASVGTKPSTISRL